MEDRPQGDHEVPLGERVPRGGGYEGDLLSDRWGYAIAPGDRTPLFYEISEGDERCAPIVLCDGIGCDGYVWRYLRRDLASRTLLHPHYRGHGRSAAPVDPTRVSIPDLADDLAAVLDDAGIERAVLAGHSMGVQVALETYRRHRSRVVGLLLLCGAPSHPLRTFRGTATLEKVLPQVERWILRAPQAVNRLKRALVPTRLAFEVASRLEINRTLVDPGDFMPYLEGLARIDVRLFIAMLAEAGKHSADDLLPTIDVPSLIVAGDRDGFTPPDRSRAMAASIPGADLLIVEDGSHTAPIERPALVGEIIERFLTTRLDPLFRQRN